MNLHSEGNPGKAAFQWRNAMRQQVVYLGTTSVVPGRDRHDGLQPLFVAQGLKPTEEARLVAPSKTLGFPSLYRFRRRPPIMSIGGVWAARAFAAAGSASKAVPSKTLGFPSLYRFRRRPPIMSIGGV